MTVADAKPRRLRLRFPIGVIIAATLGIIALHHREWVETYIAAISTIAICFFSTLAIAGWFAFFSAFTRKTRIRGIAVFACVALAAVLALKTLTRVDGTISGVGVPRFVWRWTPRTGENLGALQIASDAHVDLTIISPTDSPRFLGQDGTNAVRDVPLATDWTKQPPRKLWRQPVGLGWGSFAIVGDFAITQEQRGQSELTVCYDVTTGKALWEHSHDNLRFVEWQGGDGPRATPTIDHGRVYVVGATGILDCLDGRNGNPIWSHDVLAEQKSGNLTWGKSCSPLVSDDLVVVTGGAGGPSVVAYHKADGSLAWAAGQQTPGYASPVVATLAGRKQIITINAESVEGFAIEDGSQLWTHSWPGKMPKVANPVPLGAERVLITCGYGIGAAVLHVENSGSSQRVSEIWSNRYLKPKLSNVVIKDHYVYGLDDAILTCLDLTTGKKMWRGENYGFGQLLLVDDKILVQAESGDVVLVEANPAKFTELTRFAAIEGKTWNNLALSGHRLLVRNDHEAACYELPQ